MCTGYKGLGLITALISLVNQQQQQEIKKKTLRVSSVFPALCGWSWLGRTQKCRHFVLSLIGNRLGAGGDRHRLRRGDAPAVVVPGAAGTAGGDQRHPVRSGDPDVEPGPGRAAAGNTGRRRRRHPRRPVGENRNLLDIAAVLPVFPL